MDTVFDYLTVGCFFALAAAFFTLTNREPRTLLQILVAGVVCAVANQIGNAGYMVLGGVLILAGVAYTILVIKSARAT
jgi:hypothetical protein